METTIEKTHDLSWLGKRIRVYVDSAKDRISRIPTNYTIDVSVIGVAKEHESPCFIIGSKSPTVYLLPRLRPGVLFTYSHDQAEYQHGAVVPLPITVAHIFDQVNPSNPSHCKKCGYENLSGAPNTVDGDYICHQCSIFLHIFGA